MTLYFDLPLAGMCDSQQQQQQQQLVYEPSSNATPIKLEEQQQQQQQQRRKRRSLFGANKQSPMPKVKRKSTIERRACLTEILWEDVQKAKELLGFRKPEAGLNRSSVADESVKENSTTQFGIRRSKKHRRASSNLTTASSAAAAAVASSSVADETATSLSSADASLLSLPDRQWRVARFWELKRCIRDLLQQKMAKERQLELLQAEEMQLAASASQEPSESAQLRGDQQNLQQSQQLCFPTQYLVAVSEDSTLAQSELTQLQEEACVQRAVVDANARLLRECQNDRQSRQVKRKRTHDYHRSQEKLRMLHQRISELRTRDSGCELRAESLAPIDDSWSASLPSLNGEIPATACNKMRSSDCVSHACSVDSGIQEMSSSSTSLSTNGSHSSEQNWLGYSTAFRMKFSTASLQFVDQSPQKE